MRIYTHQQHCQNPKNPAFLVHEATNPACWLQAGPEGTGYVDAKENESAYFGVLVCAVSVKVYACMGY